MPNKKTVAYVIGRFSPAHKGHILFILWLFEQFDEVIIGLGSCYEVGSDKHPLLAIFREKIMLQSLIDNGVDPRRASFVHLQDFKGNWLEWWQHITSISRMDEVTHFVTGNEDQILNMIRALKLEPPFEIINPEKDVPKEYSFPYHATDLREAIRANDYNLFLKIASSGTIALMGNIGGFSAIREALKNNGTKFVPGRQTVDVVVTCRSPKPAKRMVLCGYRKKSKENFPGVLGIPGGAIETYESPMDAAVRELGEETGVEVKIVARHLEPAHVLVNGIISEMRFVKLFSTEDPNIGGTQGGSSQVFHIDLDVTPEAFEGLLKSESDLERVAFRSADYALRKGLAYEQSDMLRRALNI